VADPRLPALESLPALGIDPARRACTLRARVGMHEGIVEYALVGEAGKAHESIFVTDLPPREIHAACLMLGAPPAPLPDPETGAVPGRPATPVEVLVRWREGASWRETPLADLFRRRDGGPLAPDLPLPPGGWVYTASVQGDGFFLGDREGSIISVIDDYAAIINHAATGAEDDDRHIPNAAALPPLGTPVLIEIRFPPR
jgi:hypothetical protein